MWNKIQGFFSKIGAFLNGSSAGRMIKNSIALMLQEVGPAALDILFTEALRLAKIQDTNINLEGALKAANAQKALIQFAEVQGLKVGRGMVNKAIEIAVDQLRK